MPPPRATCSSRCCLPSEQAAVLVFFQAGRTREGSELCFPGPGKRTSNRCGQKMPRGWKEPGAGSLPHQLCAAAHHHPPYPNRNEVLLPRHQARQASALELFTHPTPPCSQGRSLPAAKHFHQEGAGHSPPAPRSSLPRESLHWFAKRRRCRSQRWLHSSAGQNTPS